MFATWEAPDYGTGAVEQATYLPDGVPLQSPEVLPGSASSGVAPLAAPAIAVDSFERPFITWSSAGFGSAGAIAYSGGYLSATNSLNFLRNAVNDPLTPADIMIGGGTVSSLDSRVNSTVSDAESDLSSSLCSAENETAWDLYSNVTHVPLVVRGPTACSYTLRSDPQTSSITTSTGVGEPNTYFAVYGDWALEALGATVAATPFSNVSGLFQSVALNAYLPAQAWDNTTVDSQPEQIHWTPTPYSPTALELVVTSTLPSWSSGKLPAIVCHEDPEETYSYTLSTYASTATTTITINNGSAHAFSQTGALPSVWLYNLTADQNYYWTASESVTNVEYEDVTNDECSPSYDGEHKVSPVAYGAASDPTLSASGTFATTLGIVPGSPSLVKATYGASTAAITVQFAMTLPAGAAATLANDTASQSITAYTPSMSFANSFSKSSGEGVDYDLTVNATSRSGSSQSPGSPSLAVGTSGRAPPETASAGCTFTLPTSSSLPSLTVTNPYSNPGATTMEVSWTGSQDILGFFTYSQLGSSLSWTITNITPTQSGSNWNYQLEIHGLSWWTSYSGVAGVSWENGCLTNVVEESAGTFSTLDVVALSQSDLPYDSVSETGGGAALYWQFPYSAISDWTGATFVSGAVLLTSVSSSETVVVPISGQNEIYAPGGTSEPVEGFQFNITPTESNATYSVSIFLNYSVSGSSSGWNVTSPPCKFVYEMDSSGDGLTNLEKVNGWVVPLPNSQTFEGIGLSSTTSLVTADPWVYDTNGLVGDYVEKEFDLNPRTIDTAGSHMLDTWNLTFNLGSAKTATLPTSGFEYWYENASYNPFQGVDITGKNITNLSASAGHGITSGDGSPWAARALWLGYGTGSALSYLEGLVSSEDVGWLRAVTGTWDGLRTLTVWGKLSWGADPLVASTPQDGIPDGSRLDPLGGTDIQVTVTKWSVSGLSSGNGVAAFIDVTSAAAAYYPSGQTDYDGYTAQSTASGSSTSFSGSDLASFPVVPTEQYASLNVSLAKNTSTSSKPALSQIYNSGALSVNLTNLTVQHFTASSLSFSYQVLSVFAKAPTWILAPANNTTLSPLPAGLSRYTAEQDFALLVLNDTAPKGSTPTVVSLDVLGPQLSWSYPVTLQPGLNNFLVPRSLFLSSLLGQALINATAIALPSSHEDSALTYHPGDWTGRVVNASSNRPGSTNFISVFSNSTRTSASGDATQLGGIPSNPAIEAGYEARQVQAVFWINVSSAGDGRNFTSASAELTDLLGGLLLNASGNLTGNLINETTELPTLGLSSNVLTALANSSIANGGAYGAPASESKSSTATPWYDVAATSLWNAVSGVVSAVGKLVSVVWNAAIAAAAYLADAATALARDLGITALLSQTVTALRAIGSAMWTALQQLLQYIYGLVKAALAAVVSPIVDGVKGFASALGAAANATLLDENEGVSFTAAQGMEWADAIDPLAILGTAVAATIVIVLAILTPVDIGDSFLISIVLSLIPALALGLLSGLPATSSFSSQAVTTFEDSFSNSLSSEDWGTWAAVVAVWAPLGDLYAALMATMQDTVISGPPALSLLGSIVIDVIVFAISIVVWLSHLGPVAAAALFLAAYGAYYAAKSLINPRLSLIKTYSTVSLILAAIGLGAASADFVAAEGL